MLGLSYLNKRKEGLIMRRFNKLTALLLTAVLAASGSMSALAAEEQTPPATVTSVIDDVSLINYYIQNLDVAGYIKCNPKLVPVLGDNLSDYVLHYVYCGIKEGRKTSKWDPVAFVINNADNIRAGSYTHLPQPTT